MPFSKETVDYFFQRNTQLENCKKRTKIGIFGSFHGPRKAALHALKKFLNDNGYNAQISEDLDKRPEKDKKKIDPIYDRKLSEKLLEESDIHIFVLAREHEDEPSNLIQSVSMEMERLHTLSESGRKSEKYVVVFAETGLIGTMGGVCEGLLLEKKGDWPVGEFDEIQDTFKPSRQVCMNFIQDMYSF
jgi:hypothetical protein